MPPSREIEVIVVPPGGMFELPPPEPTAKRTDANTKADTEAKSNAMAGAKSNAKNGAKSDAMAEDPGSDRAESFPDLDFTVTAESSTDDPPSGVHAATRSGPRNALASGPRAAPSSGPRGAVSSRPATRAAGASSTADAPAPRKRRSVAWPILLMIALGGGAMATAYFWPDLSVALGLDEP